MPGDGCVRDTKDVYENSFTVSMRALAPPMKLRLLSLCTTLGLLMVDTDPRTRPRKNAASSAKHGHQHNNRVGAEV